MGCILLRQETLFLKPETTPSTTTGPITFTFQCPEEYGEMATMMSFLNSLSSMKRIGLSCEIRVTTAPHFLSLIAKELTKMKSSTIPRPSLKQSQPDAP